ncbi:MAG: M12 family metallopeptidase [Granulosicoccaceae bacterium]
MLDGTNSKTCAKLALLVSLAFSSGALAANAPHLLEGDILSQTATQLRAAMHARVDRVWPTGVIPYVLHEDLTAIEKTRVLEAAQHWNDRTAISLVPLNDAPAELQQDYLMFTQAKGCASWVGRQGGEQEIWIGADCSVGSMIHEIGHAVGFVHEHTRPDRDQYITIAWGNIAPEKQHNFDVPDHAVKTRGAYDYNSIMHYGEMFFSTNGSPTIVAISDETTNMGQRVALSEGDIAAVQAMYGSELTLASTQNVIDGNTALSITVSNLSVQTESEIVVTIPTEGRAVLAQSNNQWQCAVGDAAVRCALDTLPGSASSDVVVLLQGLYDFDLEISLDARAHVSNNANGSVAENTVIQADSVATQASGAGSFGWMILLIFMPLIISRKNQHA